MLSATINRNLHLEFNTANAGSQTEAELNDISIITPRYNIAFILLQTQNNIVMAWVFVKNWRPQRVPLLNKKL